MFSIKEPTLQVNLPGFCLWFLPGLLLSPSDLAVSLVGRLGSSEPSMFFYCGSADSGMWALNYLRDVVTGYYYPSIEDEDDSLSAEAQLRVKKALELKVIDYIDEPQCLFCGKEILSARLVHLCACIHSYLQLVCHHAPFCEVCLTSLITSTGRARCGCSTYTTVPSIDVLAIVHDRGALIEEQKQLRDDV